jgi:hypothetical protein
VTLLGGLTIALATPAAAQNRGNLAGKNRGNLSDHRIPAVGTELPELKAFDEFGNPFSTSSLRGSYSVLVFGCLT